jgi:mannose-6-phosphate isomerase-like protein (cupin superfamily)
MKKITTGMWIENPIMGQQSMLMKLPAETGGRYFETEYVCKPFTGRSAIPLHYHPTYTEHFQILSGKARYILGKTELSASLGDELIFPPKINHIHPWSDSNQELRVHLISEANPPDMAGLNANINTAVTLFGLARNGKVGKDGLPNILQQAVSGRSILPGACPAGLSIGSARIILGFLAMIGYLAGYRVSYPEYGKV